MMKKNLAVLFLWCLFSLSLTGCSSGADPNIDYPEYSDETEWEKYEFSWISGNWGNEDKSSMLQINEDGQIWYIGSGEVLFRGYLERMELSEADTGYEYHYRYDCYNDADMLMTSFFYDTEEGFFLEADLDGTFIDQYEYGGSAYLAENQYVGNWYIQGASDAYCLKFKLNETWELCYPGADGEIIGSGICIEDDSGRYDLVIDEEQDIHFGRAERKEEHMEVGVNITSPYQIEKFSSYYFYAEEDSAPRISSGNYTGWWYCQELLDEIEIRDDGQWSADDEEVSGTCQITENGIILLVENGDDENFAEGNVLEFYVYDNRFIYEEIYDLTLVPYYQPLY